MDLALLYIFQLVPNNPLRLELSTVQKKELFSFMKSTRDKEEYRRASAIKQKIEGVPYRTIARNVGVNYRNVYEWIKKIENLVWME